MFTRGRFLAVAIVIVLLAPMMPGQSVRGREILVTTVEELALIASGRWKPINTPHAGGTLSSGDVIIILAPGIYDIGSQSINVTLSGLVIKSSDGAEATVIRSTSTAFTIKGEDITVQGLTISEGEVGIEIIDARRVKILNNRVVNAGIGVKVARADGVLIDQSNKIVSNDVGIELEASTNVWVLRNDIRNNKVGIKVLRNSCSIGIHENNIARNEIGLDASESSCIVYACKNWWGEPIGLDDIDDIPLPPMPPRLPPPPPPPGQVKGPVETQSCPPWPSPPLPCIAIESLTADETEPPVSGYPQTFRLKIKNTCAEKTVTEMASIIKDSLGNIIHHSNRRITLDRLGSFQETFSFIFTISGEYSLTVQTLDDIKTIYIRIRGSYCLPLVLDLNKNKVIDDLEIIVAIDIWVREDYVPFPCDPPVKIDDIAIIKLIDLWIKQAQVVPGL